MLSRTVLATSKNLSVKAACCRALATKTELTAEEIEKGIEKAAKYKKFISKSAAPTTMSAVLPTGADLHVPENMTEIAALSGMPSAQAARTVVIAPRVRKSQQSGDAFSHQWQLTWKNEERWSNPLMGWTSTADPMSNVKLHFDNKEEAIAFAEKNGWKFELQAESSSTNRPQGYTHYKDNFLTKRTAKIVAIEGHATKEYDQAGFGGSQFFMPLKYHGDGVVEQHGPAPSSGKK